MNAAGWRPFAMALACWTGLAGAADAACHRPSLHRACGTHDVLALTLLEDASADPDIDREDIDQAVKAFIEARLACRRGRVEEALRLYDEATLAGVRPNRSRWP